MKKRRSKKKIALLTMIYSGIFTFLLLLGGYFFFVELNNRYLENKIKKQLIFYYNTHLKELTNLELTELHWKSPIKKFLGGDIKDFSFVLENQDLQIKFFSSIQLDLKNISFKKLLLKGNSLPPLYIVAAPKIDVLYKKMNLSFSIQSKLQGTLPHAFRFNGQVSPLDVKQKNLKTSAFYFDIQTELPQIKIKTSLKNALYSDETKNIHININDLIQESQLTWTASEKGWSLSTLSQWNAGDSEALHGENYFKLPKEILNAKLNLKIEKKAGSIELLLASLEHFVSTTKTIQVHLTPSPEAWLFQWDLPRKNIKEYLSYFLNILQESPEETLHLLDIKKGTLESKGELKISKKWIPSIESIGDLNYFQFHGKLAIKQFSFFSEKYSLFVQNLNLLFPFDSQKKKTMDLSFEKLFFKKLEFPSFQHDFSINISPPKKKNKSPSFHMQTRKPIQILQEVFSLEIPYFSLHFPDVQLEFPLQLSVNNTQNLSTPFCIDPKWLPPAQFFSQYNKITYSKDQLLTHGQSTLKVFEGEITLKNLKIFDALTSAPESQFEILMEKIQLESLGHFLSFGKMNGTFQGYAREVTMQGLLPTQFEFLLKADPLPHKSKIVFSSQAMKNLVLLLTGDSLEQSLPGIAQWMAFGLPSQILGGYDVQYFGISLLSKKGLILLRTLDPEDQDKKDQNNYILYGPRFKIPIQAQSYPVLLDAPAMGHFVRHMIQQFENLKKSKESGEIEIQEKNNELIENKCIPDRAL